MVMWLLEGGRASVEVLLHGRRWRCNGR